MLLTQSNIGLKYACMEMPSEKNPYEKLAGFAQRILRNQYHTVMQKWNKYSAR